MKVNTLDNLMTLLFRSSESGPRGEQELQIPRKRQLAVLACVYISSLFLASCAHIDPATLKSTATIYGHVRLEIQPPLPLREPTLSQETGVQLTLWGVIEGQRFENLVVVATDRGGYFYKSGITPGQYRIASIRGISPSQYGQVPEPDLLLKIEGYETTPEKEAINVGARSHGVLDEMVFQLEPGKARYLGHLELTFGPGTFHGPGNCLVQDVILPGINGNTRFSDTPVGARLCTERNEGDARTHLMKRGKRFPDEALTVSPAE